MKKFASTLRNLSRRKKVLIIVLADCLIAFLCWTIFGPPLSILIASNFENSLYSLISANIVSFISPFVFTFLYFYFSGFYRSLIKFFDSKDSIFKAMIGSFIFGFSWGGTYLYQYEIIRTDFLTTAVLQSFLLGSVFYAFLQISRDVAKLIIYPTK